MDENESWKSAPAARQDGIEVTTTGDLNTIIGLDASNVKNPDPMSLVPDLSLEEEVDGDSDGDLTTPVDNIIAPLSWAKESPVKITRKPKTLVDLSEVANDFVKMEILKAHSSPVEEHSYQPMRRANVVSVPESGIGISPTSSANTRHELVDNYLKRPIHVVLEYDSSTITAPHTNSEKFR